MLGLTRDLEREKDSRRGDDQQVSPEAALLKAAASKNCLIVSWSINLMRQK